MKINKITKDRHLPSWLFDNPIRGLFNNPRSYNKEVKPDQVAVDIGSGPGFYTFPLADRVGDNGRVYAVDSDEKMIRKVKRKAAKKDYKNIEAHTASAARLDFIQDQSVDFVLANESLC